MEDNLDLYPLRNCEFVEEEGLITVMFYKEKLNWFDRTIFKKWASKPMKIDLDNIGTFVWKRCDGKTPVREIARQLKEELGDEFEKPEERVSLFVKQLFQGKLITLYQKKE